MKKNNGVPYIFSTMLCFLILCYECIYSLITPPRNRWGVIFSLHCVSVFQCVWLLFVNKTQRSQTWRCLRSLKATCWHSFSSRKYQKYWIKSFELLLYFLVKDYLNFCYFYFFLSKCGNEPGDLITSDDNTLTLTFKSDFLVTYDGFIAEWEAGQIFA